MNHVFIIKIVGISFTLAFWCISYIYFWNSVGLRRL